MVLKSQWRVSIGERPRRIHEHHEHSALAGAEAKRFNRKTYPLPTCGAGGHGGQLGPHTRETRAKDGQDEEGGPDTFRAHDGEGVGNKARRGKEEKKRDDFFRLALPRMNACLPTAGDAYRVVTRRSADTLRCLLPLIVGDNPRNLSNDSKNDHGHPLWFANQNDITADKRPFVNSDSHPPEHKRKSQASKTSMR